MNFSVGDKLYSLDLSSPSSCSVSEGDAFDGKADLKVTCSEEVMGKMIRKEVQPQQGKSCPSSDVVDSINSSRIDSYFCAHWLQTVQCQPVRCTTYSAFMKGMLKIKGKMNLAMKLTAVLAATRKKLPSPKL